MALKNYWFSPTSGDSRTVTGLSPTFVIFQTVGGTALAAPSISEPGASTGMYLFQYGTTQSIVFEIDAGSNAPSTGRYIKGALDPVQLTDQVLGAVTDTYGTTIGNGATTVLGKLNRNEQFYQGNAIFNKSESKWYVYSADGSSTLLFSKSLTNTTSQATKT